MKYLCLNLGSKVEVESQKVEDMILYSAIDIAKSRNQSKIATFLLEQKGNDLTMNDGLEQRTSTAEDCQTLCCATMGCNGFTWASGEFFGKIVPNIRSIISR